MITHPLRPGSDMMKNTDIFTRELAFFLDQALLTQLEANGQISQAEARAIQSALLEAHRPVYTVSLPTHRLDISSV